MRKIMNEQLAISRSSPLKARFYDYQCFTYPWHFHSEYEIIYIKESTGKCFVGNNIDTFKAGDFLLLGPNLPHYMKSDDIYISGESPLRVKGTIIQFEKEFMYYSINHYPHFMKIKNLLEESQRGVYFPAGSSSRIYTLMDSVPLETGIDQITSFLQLLKEMSETSGRYLISSSDFTENISDNTSRIDKIISYLNKHYTRNIRLEEISSFAAMNPSAFCRFFKSKTGKSFKDYIGKMRIDYACKLLLMDDMNISQVSLECGFETISYFNKTFRKNTGYTPSQYKTMMLSD